MSTKPDFRETLYTVDKRGNRKWVYSSLIVGKWFTRRALVVSVLMAIYLSMPWIQINGSQAVFLDIAGRKFTMMGTTFFATDSTFLFLTLATLAISLFFFTALLGRVWCGWACPETVFLEFVFRPIDRLFEGTAAERLRLNMGPWNLNKILRKGGRLVVYSFVAWFLASTCLAYFVGREQLLNMMAHSPAENLGTFVLTLALMGVLLFQFGWFREQFCTIVCPYARFQSVLMDAHSLVVGYDTKRGEPRGKFEKGEERKHGDCVDCGLCVRVCPTGIDIRNGVQLECIACTACVDACDSIMEKVGRPKGLIRYDTEEGFAGRKRAFGRPRVLIYGTIFLVVISVFAVRLLIRQDTDFRVVRASHDKAYNISQSGAVSNHFEVRISNKGRTDHLYTITLLEPRAKLIAPLNPFPVPAGELGMAPIFIEFPAEILRDEHRHVKVKISIGTEEVGEQAVVLLGPDEDEHEGEEHGKRHKDHDE